MTIDGDNIAFSSWGADLSVPGLAWHVADAVRLAVMCIAWPDVRAALDAAERERVTSAINVLNDFLARRGVRLYPRYRPEFRAFAASMKSADPSIQSDQQVRRRIIDGYMRGSEGTLAAVARGFDRSTSPRQVVRETVRVLGRAFTMLFGEDRPDILDESARVAELSDVIADAAPLPDEVTMYHEWLRGLALTPRGREAVEAYIRGDVLTHAQEVALSRAHEMMRKSRDEM